MKEEKQVKMKKSTKYLLIGTLVLFLSVLGASMAYYLARVSEEFGGNAAGTELAINVEKLSSNATGDLIPLDNDLETLNLAAAGYQDKGACVDINGYSVCQIYHITLTNNGSVPLTVNGTVTLSGQNVPNIDCARMDNATEVANNNSCMSGMFVSGDTLNANDHNDYYVMVYIKNLDEPQTDSGEFNGTVTFTTEDGRQVKGRFTKPFNLVQRIQTLYNVNNNDLVTNTDKTEVTNNEIKYNYATNVGLMNDRLGGTTTSLDGGNIRYYGAEPNNWIDIGDKYETDVQGIKGFEQYASDNGVDISELPFKTTEECYAFYNCESNYQELGFETVSECNNNLQEEMNEMGFESIDQFCSGETIPAGTPILWRIIGIFDGKLKLIRNDSIGYYSWDQSLTGNENEHVNQSQSINSGYGINEWSQADLMKLLNPGFENNTDITYNSSFTVTGNKKINNSLYFNSNSGLCYGNATAESVGFEYNCDFTNTGLVDGIKDLIVDSVWYLGGIDNDTSNYNVPDFFINNLYGLERGNDVIQNPEDGVERTTKWVGKVGLPYPSDYGYAADFTNCNTYVTNYSTTGCYDHDWLYKGKTYHTITNNTNMTNGMGSGNLNYYVWKNGNVQSSWDLATADVYPTIYLDPSVLAESGNGTKSTPYVLTK